jgi:lactate racemase
LRATPAIGGTCFHPPQGTRHGEPEESVSVWLRQGRDTIRLDLLERFRRPPVVAPHAPSLHSLVREAAGFRDGPPAPGRDERHRFQKMDRLLAESGLHKRFLDHAATANHVRLVLPDATRRGPWLEWVETCARWLEERTPRAVSRVALIATGVHRPAIPEGLRLPAGWTTIANGQDGTADHRDMGRTRMGTPVRLHPAWVNGDLRVVLADVSFHYFAGFGGGRKLVFPGLGEPEGILANHRLTLDDLGRLRPECAPGRLDRNPVHDDLIDAVALCPPDLLITAYDSEPGGPTVLNVGNWQTSHEEACERFQHGHALGHTQRAEILVADAGGHPRDSSFLQAHKSLQHAARFLPDGGRLLLVAGLEEGCGSPTLERLWMLDAPTLSQKALASYELHTHTALALRGVLDRIEVGVWHRGDPGLLQATGMRSFGDADEAVVWLEGGAASRPWGWLPRAEDVLPNLIGKPPAEHPAGTGAPGDEEREA